MTPFCDGCKALGVEPRPAPIKLSVGIDRGAFYEVRLCRVCTSVVKAALAVIRLELPKGMVQ
jgi:hypothetical protein